MGIRRILGATGAALVIAIAVAAPAGAAATNHSGNTQPIPSGSQNQDGKCAAGEHWVYVELRAREHLQPARQDDRQPGREPEGAAERER